MKKIMSLSSGLPADETPQTIVEVFHCFWEYIPLLMAVACRIFFSIFPPGHLCFVPDSSRTIS